MRKRYRILCCAMSYVLLASWPALSQDPIGAGPANILTWQQDTKVTDECSGCSYRTGENLNEATVTYKTIKTDAFGKLSSYRGEVM